MTTDTINSTTCVNGHQHNTEGAAWYCEGARNARCRCGGWFSLSKVGTFRRHNCRNSKGPVWSKGIPLQTASDHNIMIRRRSLMG